jgi:hypothetical protein
MYDPDSLMELIERPYTPDDIEPGDIYLNLFDYGIKLFTTDYSRSRMNKEKFLEMINYMKGLKESRLVYLKNSGKI